MARLFNDAILDYMNINQPALSAAPLVFSCWFNSNDSITNHQSLIHIGDKDLSHQQLFELLLLNSAGTQRIQMAAVEVAVGTALTADTWTPNTWQHACGIEASSTDRRVFLNGGSKGTNATNITPVNVDRTNIGARMNTTPAFFMSGMIAEAAIYDLSAWPGATNSDKADNFEKILPSLAKGFSPLCYPLGLVAYWPLIRGLNDKVGSYNMAVSGTTISPHCRVILPSSLQ